MPQGSTADHGTEQALAVRRAINPSTVTRAGERLEALGLLERARNPLNKRETLLAPTLRGRRIVERVDRDRRKVLSAIMRRLPPDRRATVVAAFIQFTAAAAASGAEA